jgi:pimeloyl-ACP methyl ester carboxylesterase
MVTKHFNNKETSTRSFDDLYPYASHFLSINGHDLHYLDEGTGTPVVMVHGNPTWSFYFRSQINALSSDYRCIVPDHIGCGFSDKPDAASYSYTLQSRVDDLDALITSLDITEKNSYDRS